MESCASHHRRWRVVGGVSLPLLLALVIAGCGEDPAAARQYIEQAKDLEEQGAIQDAILSLKDALEVDPSNPEARWLLGRIYVTTAQGAAAEKELKRAQELGVSGAGLRVPMARAYLLQGKSLELLEDIGPDPYEPVEVQGSLLALRGMADLNLGYPERARGRFSQVLDFMPTNVDALLGMARLALLEGGYNRVESLLAIVAEREPDNVDAMMVKGELLNVRQDHKAAQAIFDRALARQPSHVDGLLGRAEAFSALGELARALDDVNLAIQQRPRFAPANYLRARILFQQQDLPAAQDALQQIVRLNPSHLPSQLLLGALTYDQGNLEDAERYLTNFLTVIPSNAVARKLLAAVQMETGRPAEAIAGLLPLLEDSPEDAQLLAQLGCAYLQHRAFLQGADYLRQAIAIAPEKSRIGAQVSMSTLTGGALLTRVNDTIELGLGLQLADVLDTLVYIQQEEYRKAVAKASGLVISLPNHPMSHILLSMAYQAEGRMVLAEKYLQKARNRLPALTAQAPAEAAPTAGQ